MAECICRLCHHHRVEGEALRTQVAALTQRAEAAEALAKEWERLYNDRNAAWRSSEDRRDAAEAKAGMLAVALRRFARLEVSRYSTLSDKELVNVVLRLGDIRAARAAMGDG